MTALGLDSYKEYFSPSQTLDDNKKFLFKIELNNYRTYNDRELTTICMNLNEMYRFYRIQIDTSKIIYYKNSLYIHGLKYTMDKHYNSSRSNSTLFNTETLVNSSSNCMHTILTHKVDELDTNFFVKIVNYDNNDVDYVIFDVINGMYFYLILMKLKLSNRDLYNSLKKFISIYKYSFLSYCFEEGSSYKWDFNKICYDSSQPSSQPPSQPPYKSPYDPENEFFYDFCSLNRKVIPYKRVYVIIMDIIKHINLFKLISDMKESKVNSIIKIKAILEKKFVTFFLTLIKLGIEHGFHHNDLHLNNIIFCLDNNELAIIDFGRSCFVKLLHHEDPTLNQILLNEIIRLNFSDKLELSSKINSYKDLYDFNRNLLLSFNYNIHYKFKDSTDSTDSTDFIYPMIIFDYISLTLGMYQCLCIFLDYLETNHTDRYGDVVNEFYTKFDLIFIYKDDAKTNFTINNDSLDIDTLMKTYQDIVSYLRLITNKTNPLFKYLTTIKILLDGLLLVAILFIFKNKTATDYTTTFIHRSLVVILTIEEKDEFIKHLIYNIYQNHLSIFTTNNHYFKYIIDGKIDDINFNISSTVGGKKKGGVTMSSENNKSLISSDEFKLDIAELERAELERALNANEIITLSEDLNKNLSKEISEKNKSELAIELEKDYLEIELNKKIKSEIESEKSINDMYKETYHLIETAKEELRELKELDKFKSVGISKTKLITELKPLKKEGGNKPKNKSKQRKLKKYI